MYLVHLGISVSLFLNQSRWEPQRVPGKHYRGALSPTFCMSWDRDVEGIEREETWGGVSPHHPTRGPGERRKKEAIWNTIFSIFERGGAPKRRGAREHFPPFPPLDGPVLKTQWTALKWAARDWAARNWAAQNWAARNRDTTSMDNSHCDIC